LDVIDERQAHYNHEREEQQCADDTGEFGISLTLAMNLLRG
jgi:hypothetical protein